MQNSTITVNWFNSVNASQSDLSVYYPIIQRTVSDACPVQSCPPTFAAVRVVRIDWRNLYYQVPNSNQRIVSGILEYFCVVVSFLFFSDGFIYCIFNKYI